ncbi:type I 3-dehydroquinate dehydratase [Saccharothrix australiensis]|uniref:3-dehydroquinate dehydratase n=1 Tax=Saccharothrix australiensis TaxID=2072 RepID=A0A495VZ14_9PSEU|nr:type I 3-dehydroquinate dehydratase [Saccharothrix australiensis]RKT54586.1 3-dehydroquinate dehydratase [Saccharothrix australiensis]
MVWSPHGVTVCGVVTGPPDDSPPPVGVTALEVRADLVDDADAERWRRRFDGPVLYSLRGEATGGADTAPDDVRHARLLAAARHGDLVDLDVDRDRALLDDVPRHRRVVSAFPSTTDPAALRRLRDELLAVPARLRRLVLPADAAALAPALSAGTPRPDFTAFARGQAGAWTRVLAARWGARVAFGGLRPGDGTDGTPTAGQLLDEYHVRDLAEVDRLYGIIGGRAHRSLSPRLHNAGYRALGVPARYLPFTAVELPATAAALRAALAGVGLPLHGLTVTSPLKEAAFGIAAGGGAAARRCAAASLLVRRGDGWWAEVESAGVVAALRGHGVELRDRAVAVVGCGPSGRAAAVGLGLAGARVTLVNRDPVAGRRVADRFGLPFTPLARFRPADHSLLVSAVPVHDELLFTPSGPDTAVLDMVYADAETPLVAVARAAGLQVLDGRALLAAVGGDQFRAMTGRELPVEVAGAAVGRAVALR